MKHTRCKIGDRFARLGEIYDILHRQPAIMQAHKLIAPKEDTLRQLAIYFPRRSGDAGAFLGAFNLFRESNPFF